MLSRTQFYFLKPAFVVVCAALVSIWLMTVGVAIAADAQASIQNCNIQGGPCTQELQGRTVTLEILPRPVKAMEDLTFKVTFDPQAILSASPRIRLNMPAMDMGKNQVMLKMIAPGEYVGKGVIVRCRSGKRIWKATVVVPEVGAVDFIFDVIY